jgi:hypothetical protein
VDHREDRAGPAGRADPHRARRRWRWFLSWSPRSGCGVPGRRRHAGVSVHLMVCPFRSRSQRSNSAAIMFSSCTLAAWSDASQTIGGPITAGSTYTRARGHAAYTGVNGGETSVFRIHSGNGPHQEMDRRAIACSGQAPDDAGLDRRATAAGAARLLRLGHHDHDGALPRLGRRRPARPEPPAVVTEGLQR